MPGVTRSVEQKREDRIINRFVRARLNGAFRSDLEAARHCLAELDSLYRGSDRTGILPKTFSTIYTYIRRRLTAAGTPLKGPVWMPAEDRAVMRFTLALFAGKYQDAYAAAKACRAALLAERLRHPRRFTGIAPRTERAVHNRVALFTRRVGVPSPQRPWEPAEERILIRHARRVVAGTSTSMAAVRSCYSGLRRLWDQSGRRSPRRLKVVAGRSFNAVWGRMHVRMGELGWHTQPHRLWSPVERRRARKWLSRYQRLRESKTPWSTRDTAESLQADLAESGYERTLPACWAELKLELQGRIPEHRFHDRPAKARGSQ
jgi:hypothetical protein